LINEGKHPYNAEISIDYKNKDVSFNYLQDITRKNDWKAYGDNTIFGIIGMFVGGYMTIFLFPFLLAGVLLLLDKGVNPIFIIIWSIITIFILLYTCLNIATKALGGISIIFHENIPWLRKMYPKTNAIFHIIFNKIRKAFNKNTIIDFSEIPDDEVYLRKSFMVVGNRLIKKCNIVLSEYDLEGDCSKYIKKVYTKCIEEKESKRKNPGVGNFMIVFEFSQRPKNGKVVIL